MGERVRERARQHNSTHFQAHANTQYMKLGKLGVMQTNWWVDGFWRMMYKKFRVSKKKTRLYEKIHLCGAFALCCRYRWLMLEVVLKVLRICRWIVWLFSMQLNKNHFRLVSIIFGYQLNSSMQEKYTTSIRNSVLALNDTTHSTM